MIYRVVTAHACIQVMMGVKLRVIFLIVIVVIFAMQLLVVTARADILLKCFVC